MNVANVQTTIKWASLALWKLSRYTTCYISYSNDLADLISNQILRVKRIDRSCRLEVDFVYICIVERVVLSRSQIGPFGLSTFYIIHCEDISSLKVLLECWLCSLNVII